MDIASVKERISQMIKLNRMPLARKGSGAPPEKDWQPAELAAFLDHTLLKPEATSAQIKTICDEAKTFGFATVCVNGARIHEVAQNLKGSAVLPIAVVGFPLGAMLTTSKVLEVRDVIRLGAREVDVVVNIGAVKDQNWKSVHEDLKAMIDEASETPVKVILETFLLSDEEKVAAAWVARLAGAAFVKTSTGFSGGGATVFDVALLREVVGNEIGVKASGAVRTFADAVSMLKAGANRLGTSQSVSIVNPHPENRNQHEPGPQNKTEIRPESEKIFPQVLKEEY